MTACTDYATDEVMFDAFVQPHGNCKPSGYSEYDNLTGYVTDTYAREWTDKSGTRWRKVVTVINLGRPDRGVPADPERNMQPEQLATECNNVGLLKAHAQHRAVADARETRTLAALVAHLTEHGPQGYDALLAVTEWKHAGRLRAHLRAHPDTYVELQTNPVIWGLHGQRYSAPPRVAVVPQIALALRDTLATQGPLTISRLVNVTGLSDSTINNELKRRPDWFCIVEDRRGGRIWGVRGIHDQQGAA